MRLSVAALALALCCLLAGCNALVPGTTSGETRPSVTPAAVPQSGPDAPFPGLTERRVLDAETLLDAHRAALANRSVTVQYGRLARQSTGAVLDARSETVEYATDRRAVVERIDERTPERTVRTRRWANATVSYARTTVVGDDDATYTVGPGRPPYEIPRLTSMREALTRLDGERVNVESVGDGRYRVAAVNLPDGRAFQSNTTISMVVDDRGFVSSFRLTYDDYDDYEDEAFRVVETLQFSARGTTTVERPDWLPAAQNATTPPASTETQELSRPVEQTN